MCGSPLFYDVARQQPKIKSPVELIASALHLVGNPKTPKGRVLQAQKLLGQVLLYPPNVAGWPGGKSWIDSSTLISRLLLPDILLNRSPLGLKVKDDGDVNNLLNETDETESQDTIVPIDWPAFATQLAANTDAEMLSKLSAIMLNVPLPPEKLQTMLSNMRGKQTPAEKLKTATLAIMGSMEYQLC